MVHGGKKTSMKSKVCHLISTLFVLSIAIFPFSASASMTTIRYKVPSKFENWNIEIYGYAPSKNWTVKGVIFVVPGTNGFAEPNITQTNLSNKLTIKHPTDLAKTFVDAGYIYLTANYRGVRSFYECINQNEIVPKAFVDNCVDLNIRKTLDFEKIEADIESALLFIKSKKELGAYPLIVTAVSEGGIHVSRLIQQKKINPVGIIGIGIPTTSAHDNIKTQISLSVELRIVLSYMKKNGRNKFCPSDIKKALPYISDESDQIIRNNLFQVCRVDSDMHAYMNEARKLVDKQLLYALREAKPFEGTVFGLKVSEYFGYKWLLDVVNDRDSLYEKLSRYQGSVYLLYGQFDSTVEIKLVDFCKSNRRPKHLCKIEFLPNSDHVLEDKSSTIPKETLNLLVKYANSIVHGMR